MSQGFQEFFALTEKGAQRLAEGAKALLGVVCVVGALALSSDAIDRLANSTPSFALRQAWREAMGQRSFQEKETQALIAFAQEQTGLWRLRFLRTGLANGLEGTGAQAEFNWASFRVSLGERLDGRDVWEQRWVSLHEIGHAAAFSTFRVDPYPLEAWGLSEATQAAMRSSLVYQQAYAEAFADVFALALSLRLDDRDPEAHRRLSMAFSGRLSSLSLAHDTDAALRLASERLPHLKRARGRELMGLLDALASEGAARSVSQWGAEREALCSAGSWRWVSWARSEGHMSLTPPWDLASAKPPVRGDPMELELRELMAFRGAQGAMTREGVEQELENYLREALRIQNADPALRSAWAPAESWGAELARNESRLRHPARQSLIGPLSAWARWSSTPRPTGCRF